LSLHIVIWRWLWCSACSCPPPARSGAAARWIGPVDQRRRPPGRSGSRRTALSVTPGHSLRPGGQPSKPCSRRSWPASPRATAGPCVKNIEHPEQPQPVQQRVRHDVGVHRGAVGHRLDRPPALQRAASTSASSRRSAAARPAASLWRGRRPRPGCWPGPGEYSSGCSRPARTATAAPAPKSVDQRVHEPCPHRPDFTALPAPPGSGVRAQASRSRSPRAFRPLDQRLQHRRCPGILRRDQMPRCASRMSPGADVAPARCCSSAVVRESLSLGSSSPRKPAGRPAHVGASRTAPWRPCSRAGEVLPPGARNQRPHRLTRHRLQALGRPLQLGTVLPPRLSVPGCLPACAPMVGRTSEAAVGPVGQPGVVVPGVRAEGVAQRRRGQGAPPGCPLVIQAPASGLGALVGQEKGDRDLLVLQHPGHQRRHAHVAGVEGQVDRLAAGCRLCGRCSAC
jgi:hypothetical protein